MSTSRQTTFPLAMPRVLVLAGGLAWASLAAALTTADPWSTLPGWRADATGNALSAFKRSCRQTDVPEADPINWLVLCDEADQIPETDHDQARRFFENNFFPTPIDPGNDVPLITGYYEPILAGSRQRDATYRYPIYRLIDTRLSRAEIDAGEATPLFRDHELLYLADEFDRYLLHIQGSGRIRLPNGEEVKVTYAGDNQQAYASLGYYLLAQGELQAKDLSLPGLRAWVRLHPTRFHARLGEANPRYIFFKEVPPPAEPQPGPPGTLGVGLTPKRSLAVDPSRIPLGLPIYLATTWGDKTPLQALMVAQDKGAAITGRLRADVYVGSGPDAEAIAGRLKQTVARAWVLRPRPARD